MNETVIKGLITSGYGLAGVFVVLILFYLLTKLLVKFAK
ncbi:MAG TPA: OadG-related small transporter subunit [Bacillota bacterium]|nr:OadG-related small transporter subunit [Bacillota bacterium]